MRLDLFIYLFNAHHVKLMLISSGPIVSSLVNKYGCRTITIVGALIAAFGLGISTMATSVTTLYVTIGLLAG